MISAALQQKADHMVDRGSVAVVPDSRVLVVKGEHDTYLVTLAGRLHDGWRVMHCTCRAQTECSHIAAAKRVAKWEGSS